MANLVHRVTVTATAPQTPDRTAEGRDALAAAPPLPCVSSTAAVRAVPADPSRPAVRTDPFRSAAAAAYMRN